MRRVEPDMSILSIRTIIPGIFILLALAPFSLNAGEQLSGDTFIHHDLRVVIYPQEHRFAAEDTVTIPDHILPEFLFFLHKGLNPISQSEGVYLTKEAGKSPYESLESYKVRLAKGMKKCVISYGGMINHPLEQVGKEQARGYSHTMGKIADEGIYLSGSSYWYPVVDSAFLTFSLEVELPRDWDAVSQGERTLHEKDHTKTHVRWTSSEPQEEVYLVAGKFHEYDKAIVRTSLPHFSKGGLGGITHDNIQAMVFLRTPDQVLADKYLEATVRSISMYGNLIGPYPYKKFALVENFWETGFGMPSFTLLGPKVIRFPFIINTSYPHEILHTWWGNSVFPAYEKGNWAEGLTAYLSDHLNAEQQGGGADYRQNALQKYTDYVSGGKDFPLTAFRSRHSSSSEAIGYGKSLMFFHMLRLELGDEVFIRGLQDFYRKNRFHYATFDDLRKSFEDVTGNNLRNRFEQWITKPGAPQLKIINVQAVAENDGYLLTASVEQAQGGQPYHFLLPVAVTMEGREQAYQTALVIDRERFEMKLALPARPVRIDFDPEFDVFRRLDRHEIPPALTQVLGARNLLFILPSSAEPHVIRAYRSFADALGSAGPDQVEIKLDNEISHLPSDRVICILDKSNRYSPQVMSALTKYGINLNPTSVRIGNTAIPFGNHSIVLTGRNPENQDMALLFITADSPEALKGLSRKLPHYHKYSYLAFRGDEPENIAKGRWPVTDSPMTVFLEDKRGIPLSVEMGKLNQRKPLAIAANSYDFYSEKVMETTRFLASDEPQGKSLGSKD